MNTYRGMGVRRLRLLRVAVQPTFVIDDGENFESEITGPVMQVQASEWAPFTEKSFSPEDLEALLARYDAERVTQELAPPNRATRRASTNGKRPTA